MLGGNPQGHDQGFLDQFVRLFLRSIRPIFTPNKKGGGLAALLNRKPPPLAEMVMVLLYSKNVIYFYDKVNTFLHISVNITEI